MDDEQGTEQEMDPGLCKARAVQRVGAQLRKVARLRNRLERLRFDLAETQIRLDCEARMSWELQEQMLEELPKLAFKLAEQLEARLYLGDESDADACGATRTAAPLTSA